MQKSELSSVFSLSSDPKELDIDEINALSSQYPYCSSLRMLSTKLSIENEELGIEQKLRRTAAHVINRKQLHQYIFKQKNETQKNDISIGETKSNNSDISATELEKQHDQTSSTVESSNNIEQLEKQILTSAISSSISLEVDNSINFEELDSLLPKKETQINDSDDLEDQPQSFGDWIKMFGGDIEEQESQSQLFDDRLPQKQEFYSAAKMAKLSVQDNNDLVTETLANIYADQENYEKAIKAFEKLQLKYPEKRIYFAGRIKEIQIQQNKQ